MTTPESRTVESAALALEERLALVLRAAYPAIGYLVDPRIGARAILAAAKEHGLVIATRDEIGELVWTVLNETSGLSSWMWEDVSPKEQEANFTKFALEQLDHIRESRR